MQKFSLKKAKEYEKEFNRSDDSYKYFNLENNRSLMLIKEYFDDDTDDMNDTDDESEDT